MNLFLIGMFIYHNSFWFYNNYEGVAQFLSGSFF